MNSDPRRVNTGTVTTVSAAAAPITDHFHLSDQRTTGSAVVAVWFLYLLGYNMIISVWVGLIALLGVDAETGVFMLLYLDRA
jgi:hypothetical protein